MGANSSHIPGEYVQHYFIGHYDQSTYIPTQLLMHTHKTNTFELSIAHTILFGDKPEQ